jgi:RNA polymerase sigma factor (TIGR02999 family)
MSTLTLTEQLQRFSDGDREIAEIVIRATLPELHRIAVRELRRERYVVPLQATELINEAWLRSFRKGGWKIHDRSHFYAIAALAMRRVLVDYARQRLAQRRDDGNIPLSLDENISRNAASDFDLEAIASIGLFMEKLEQEDGEICRVVDMHYFAGFTFEQVAQHTNVPVHRVRRQWDKGRKWIIRYL